MALDGFVIISIYLLDVYVFKENVLIYLVTASNQRLILVTFINSQCFLVIYICLVVSLGRF